MTYEAAQPDARRQDRLLRWVVLSAYALSLLLPVRQLDQSGLVLCALRHFTGLPCPGCGMTHAFVAISHGHLAEAFRYNALSFAVYPAGLLYLSGSVIPSRFRRTLPSLPEKTRTRLWWCALAASLAFGLFRILVPAARPF